MDITSHSIRLPLYNHAEMTGIHSELSATATSSFLNSYPVIYPSSSIHIGSTARHVDGLDSATVV